MSEFKEKVYELFLFGFGSEDLPPFNLSLEKGTLEGLPPIEILERYINNAYKYIEENKKRNVSTSKTEMVEYWSEVLEQIRDSYKILAKEIRTKHKNKLFKELLHKLERAKYYLRKRFTREEIKELI